MHCVRLTSFSRHTLFRCFSTSVKHELDFTHAVIGGGVVGLASARRLQTREGASTILLEKHGMAGRETSSRNSEVVHAGLYYGTQSLKAELCVRGKELLYHLCRQHAIPHRKTGKWIVAQTASQMAALQRLHSVANHLGVPTRFLSAREARDREPAVRAEAGVLESQTTGIVDSHALMQFLQGDFEDQGGLCAFQSQVIHVQPMAGGSRGWEITARSAGGEETRITASLLVNAAGLYAAALSNMILPPCRHVKAYFAKGTYFSYSKSTPRTSTLIYPAPVPGHAGLGTHLTLDLAGRIRFGPDVSWTEEAEDYRPNVGHLPAAIKEIQSYLPDIDVDAVTPDYAGIRPKLQPDAVSQGTGFQDFYIKREQGFEGFVNLLAIESPGLTSALAIAERVERLLYG